jgi:hypothetical protein
MATTIIRPNSTVSSTGWNYSGTTLATRIGDNTSTTILQSSQTCNFTVGLTDDSAYSGGTIISAVVSMTAFAGRSGASTNVVYILNANGDQLQSNTFDFTSTTTTHEGQAYDAGELSSSDIDGLQIKVAPDVNGVEVIEVFLTIEYTPAAVVVIPVGMTLSSGKLIMTGKITY